MKNSGKFAGVRRLLMIFCGGALLTIAFWNFKIAAQPQISPTPPSPNPSATATPMPSPTPIPLPDIIGEKEKTERRLQEIDKIYSEQFPVMRMQSDFFALIKDFDAREQDASNLITDNPSLEALDKNEAYWSSLSLSLPSRKNRIQTQAGEISAQLTELQNLRSVWELTGKTLSGDSPAPAATPANTSENPINTNAANSNAVNSENKRSSVGANRRASENANFPVNANQANVGNSSANAGGGSPVQLPGNLKGQIGEVIERINRTQNTVQFKFGEVIKLQEKSSDIEKRTDDVLARIAVARRLLLSNLVVRDAPPIWSAESFAPEFRQRAGDSFSERFAALQNYFTDNRGLFLVHFLIALALILAFRKARACSSKKNRSSKTV